MDTANADALVAAACALALQLSRELTGEQTALLGSFFTCLGDNLALLAQ